MKERWFRLVLLAFLATTLHSFAQDSDFEANDTLGADSVLVWPRNIQVRIDTLLESKIFDTSMVGLQVYDLTADSVVYTYNERQLMRPASTMKMIVAVTALEYLGRSYQFKTRLSRTGNVDGSVLKGNLYVKGGMDPCFGPDDIRAFVESVKRLGVDTIKGNICVDLSMKDGDMLGEGWCWDDDNPVLSPLLVDGKNNFLSCFYEKLGDEGVVVVGDSLRAAVPSAAKELCTRFHTMDEVLKRMMKDSDNQYAESVFYQLAAASGIRNAKASHCRKVVNRLISKLGLKPADYYIADGSGLSLYNYVSPELEVRFLRYAFKNKDIYTPLFSSMPVAGVDGTLSKRMTAGFAKGNVTAKTGTVTGVSALAGYCVAANGHQLCFSIINMGIQKAAIGRGFQDKMCEALCRP